MGSELPLFYGDVTHPTGRLPDNSEIDLRQHRLSTKLIAENADR